jgi:hypothetical protein
VVRAIEHDKSEISVAPLRQRALARFAMMAPEISGRLAGSAAMKAADSQRADRHALERLRQLMIRVMYGVMPEVRTGDTVTAGSVASIICPFPMKSATLWLPSGP